MSHQGQMQEAGAGDVFPPPRIIGLCVTVFHFVFFLPNFIFVIKNWQWKDTWHTATLMAYANTLHTLLPYKIQCLRKMVPNTQRHVLKLQYPSIGNTGNT